MDPDIALEIFGAICFIILPLLLICGIIYALNTISRCKLLRRMGQSGGFAFLPFFGIWKLSRGVAPSKGKAIAPALMVSLGGPVMALSLLALTFSGLLAVISGQQENLDAWFNLLPPIVAIFIAATIIRTTGNIMMVSMANKAFVCEDGAPDPVNSYRGWISVRKSAVYVGYDDTGQQAPPETGSEQ